MSQKAGTGEDGGLTQPTRAALQTLRRELRGKSLEEAQAHLGVVLREQKVFLPAAVLRRLARQLLDPWWALKHPLRSWWELQRAAGEDAVIETAGNRLEELQSRLERVPELRAVHSTLLASGDVGYVVTVEPWTPELAARIRLLAAPMEVHVHPVE